MGSDLEDETTTVEVLDFESVEDRRQVLRLELNIHDGTNNRLDVTDSSGSLRSVGTRCKTRMNASANVLTAFRNVLTCLLMSSASRSGIGVVSNRRKGRPGKICRGREEGVCPLGRAEGLFSRARDSSEAPGR